MAKPPDKTPHYHGHRQRLRDRLVESGGDSLADYELLELLLFYSIPRVDVKPLAKALIDRFGDLGAVLSAPADQLAEFDKLGAPSHIHFAAIREAGLRMARRQASERPVLAAWDKLLDYCHAAMAHSMVEEFRLLFLDAKNKLIADEVQQTGTVDHTPVYPREVVKRALDLGASAIIMVHNHPSGDPTPSKGDIEMTKEVKDAAEKMGISVHDHLIIGRDGHTSLRAEGLI
ncbi:MAG: DNA repair protein RadC [Rhodospirillaceae bacterium]|jgi:DNA repair protein RadC|nr:DNA repair protein RadC [Rhodospirillaceae bacterium]